MGFDDHHAYSDDDLDTVFHASEETGADVIFTTEKDYVRIAGRVDWPVDLVIIGVDISFDDDAFDEFITGEIGK